MTGAQLDQLRQARTVESVVGEDGWNLTTTVAAMPQVVAAGISTNATPPANGGDTPFEILGSSFRQRRLSLGDRELARSGDPWRRHGPAGGRRCRGVSCSGPPRGLIDPMEAVRHE
jgi:hypothetical protein